MTNFFNSFYAKISAIFLLLILILGGVMGYVTYRSSVRFIRETDQKLNVNLAPNMSKELEAQIGDSLRVDDIKNSIHYMMVFNPKIEIYVLDHGGAILAYFADPPQKVKAARVDLHPIRSYLQQPGQNLILGPDPRNPGEQRPFSASTLQIGSRTGYLYIILGGEQYASAFNMLKDSYIFRTALIALGLAILATGLLGLVIFAFLTRRLRRMTATVRSFERGDQQERIRPQSDDELGQLGSSFDAMADTITAQIQKLNQNDRLRRELIANISHDLRSPLASMQGYLETILLKDHGISEEERRNYLKIIFKNTASLSLLVEELFELSKLEARQVEKRCEPFSISDLCQDIVLKLRPEADKQGINLQLMVDAVVPLVNADIRLVERAVTNLLRNALRYSEPEGNVELIVIPMDGWVRVKVSDDGCGISEEDLPHIFDRFYKGKSRNGASNSKSTGLGLTIARKIVQLHESDLAVQSRVGEGTTFSFDLHAA